MQHLNKSYIHQFEKIQPSNKRLHEYHDKLAGYVTQRNKATDY